MTPTQAVENVRNEVRRLMPIVATLRLQYDTLVASGGVESLAEAFPQDASPTLQEFGEGVAALARINSAINTDLAALAKLL